MHPPLTYPGETNRHRAQLNLEETPDVFDSWDAEINALNPPSLHLPVSIVS